jgi:hypothetical protein
MSIQKFIAHIIGNPNVPNIKEVNVRSVPGTGANSSILFRLPVGTRDCEVLEVQIDPQQTALEGKVYQWFKLVLPNNQQGWIRDDLLEIIGDGTKWGYGVLSASTYAWKINRTVVVAPSGAAPVISSSTPAPAATTIVTPNAAAIPGMTPTASPTPGMTATAPATPAPAAAPAATPAPTTTPATPAPTAAPVAAPAPMPAVPTGRVIARTGANLRQAPVSGAIINKLDFGTTVTVIGSQAQPDTNYYWVKVKTPNAEGFIRNTFLSIAGNASAYGLSSGDEYPGCMKNYWWVRGFGLGQKANDGNELQHDGWDLGAALNEPVYAGPRGGVVTQINHCTKCKPGAESTLKQGLSLGDPNVFKDEGWGFGYGNFVVVRYDNSLLPASTKQRLVARNMPNAHVFVMYAHLASFSVQNGQQLTAGQQIGGCGNTGNSEAEHVHLEVRFGNDANARWATMRDNRVDPSLLFLR